MSSSTTANTAANTTFRSPIQLAAAAGLASLKPSPRLPVLFLGHGSPMNAIEDGRNTARAGRHSGNRCLSAMASRN